MTTLASNQRLRNQIALVTGGSSGIGAGVCLALAAEGATVIVNYAHSPDGAKEVVEQIEKAGGKALAIECDVSHEEDVLSMFQQIREQFGTLHILVNNSGIQEDASFLDMTLEQWNKVLAVNLTGQFLCAREAAREFIRRGPQPEVSTATGKIICMSSVHEVIPWAGHVNYATSKGGIMLLMKSIAQELAPHKIRVNSIGPGAIKTPINNEAWETPEAAEKLLTLIPYGRIGEPADIGKVAVWLASDESDYVTGTTLFADGGMTLYPGFASNG
ncbi:SDR family oxidoreductase [Hymenobacter taeanensis]|uniref:SDR family oxidoreductase n=1 Tax=Hymenobacter taeanensis TaxID=2735321 RepID=A0A6M6BMP8_9BACT|nr:MULTISPECIES: SDR family oxidoreductase [Hymenobacter]QJX49094.1 SDR family oxidoreductase [Hymenobacter taeanensis]UOQ81382.1 SDR family oxidoreductase [Hymenobacter sp. 5414T-23]